MNKNIAKLIKAKPLKDIAKYAKIGDTIFIHNKEYSPTCTIINDNCIAELEKKAFYSRGLYFNIAESNNVNECQELAFLEDEIEKYKRKLSELFIQKNDLHLHLAKRFSEAENYIVVFYTFRGKAKTMDIEQVKVAQGHKLVRFGCRYNHQDTLFIAIISINSVMFNYAMNQREYWSLKYSLPGIKHIKVMPIQKTIFSINENKFKEHMKYVIL